MKSIKEKLHKEGCYNMFYDDEGRCTKCNVLFKGKKKIKVEDILKLIMDDESIPDLVKTTLKSKIQ